MLEVIVFVPEAFSLIIIEWLQPAYYNVFPWNFQSLLLSTKHSALHHIALPPYNHPRAASSINFSRNVIKAFIGYNNRIWKRLWNVSKIHTSLLNFLKLWFLQSCDSSTLTGITLHFRYCQNVSHYPNFISHSNWPCSPFWTQYRTFTTASYVCIS